ncbi:conjugative transposon protein TraJ [Segetibacter koreensis]|uniref:conjugative transposon protein TraJ n=1 Tax=Segetibacter koreensis TaxID=398037 RepID=UPI0003644F2B|nr:conjugative transposon protein TraJ [Segetibacter koreensis]
MYRKSALWAVIGILLPVLSEAQGFSDDVKGLHAVLDQLYKDMLPLCSKLIGVGQGIAGFAATWYIASRVWRDIANAEPIDLYPLFRPFVIGFAVMIFPSVLAMINGIMDPTVTATAAMMKDSDQSIAVLLKQKEEMTKASGAWQMYIGETGFGDRDKWYKYTYPDDKSGRGEDMFESIGNDIKFALAKVSYNFRNSVKEWMSEVLQLLYEAAALCINTIRTFNLIVLAILGPLVFGIAVFDGFQHTITVWIARYINTFLWLPVANIFGSIIAKIQEKMLILDLQQVQDTGDTFFSSTDMAYLVFMLIGIAGYLTVPSVANYIVHAGGGNTLLYKVSNFMSSSNKLAASTTATSAATMVKDVYGDASNMLRNGVAGSKGSDYFKDKISGK